MARVWSRGLYPIVDVGALRARGIVEDGDVLRFTQRLLGAGALMALQLRGKGLDVAALVRLGRLLGPWCRAAGVPFVINDRADVAALVGADLVHVGQDDLAPEAIEAAFPMLEVGVSTHTLGELDAALEGALGYVAMGPIFGTQTKADAAPTVGLDTLEAAASRAREAGRPLVAIGGVTLARAPAVRRAGAYGAAAISDLIVEADKVTEHARVLHRALGGE
ncbi:MAG: thiamine phosphate synthase [Myxococcales bacterium]|nr:thiamine phosphate synthase [Myxococcales bacterium]